MNLFRLRNIKIHTSALVLLVSASVFNAQSNDQNFPTPVTSNEIVGIIKARDIGDSRVTTYHYAFNGTQGDIFINVVTRNFNGDIDVYAIDGLRPLTKMVIYADTGSNETGRLVYLRKSEKLILRIEGRTPNDDPATFRIRFGGSFAALSPKSKDDAQTAPRAASNDDTEVKVNSVGTIITDVPKSSAGANSDSRRKSDDDKSPIIRGSTARDSTLPARNSESASTPGKKPDPMENIRLRIFFKDGKSVDYRMSEVASFSVDKAILTVISKSGYIDRYSFLTVAKVTIQ